MKLGFHSRAVYYQSHVSWEGAFIACNCDKKRLLDNEGFVSSMIQNQFSHLLDTHFRLPCAPFMERDKKTEAETLQQSGVSARAKNDKKL